MQNNDINTIRELRKWVYEKCENKESANKILGSLRYHRPDEMLMALKRIKDCMVRFNLAKFESPDPLGR